MEAFDLLLTEKATSPATEVGLVLAEDEEGNKRIREYRVPPLPPRRSSGPLQWTHTDPRTGLTFAQQDWSGGALAPYYEDGSKRYARAHYVDARWEGVQALGMQLSNQNDFLMRNPGAEVNDATMWTNGAMSSVTTAPRTGSRHWSTTLGANIHLYQSLANPTVYRSREITVISYVRGGGTGDVYMRVGDSAGTTAGTTVTLSTAYQYVSATRTIAANATWVRAGLYSVEGITGDLYSDDYAVIPTGGVVCNGVAEMSDALYAIFGRCVCKWDETNDVWDAVLIEDTAAATDIVEFQGNLFVGFGFSDAYQYSSNGSTWTASSRTAPDNKAKFWAVSRATLWKSESDREVASSTSGIDGGAAWSTPYTVGSSDRVITRLFAFADTILVGKEDGLHRYNRVVNDFAAADEFTNLTSEFDVVVDPDNFAKGEDWHGWLYLTTSQQSFLRFNGSAFEDLTSLLMAPRLADFGGRVRALAADPHQLWLLVDTPETDTTTTKDTRLMSLRNVAGEWRLHTIAEVSIGDINWLAVNRGYLYAFGRLYNSDLADYVSSIYRWTLPTKTPAPYADATPAIEQTISGWLETSIWHGGMPNTPKAALSLTIWCKNNLDANHTIKAEIGFDGTAPAGAAASFTFNSTGAILTKYFNALTDPIADAVGRFAQIRWTFDTNDTTSPELYAFALETTLRPLPVKAWECFVHFGPGVTLRNGNADPRAKSAVLANLATLEEQTYPIVLKYDVDGDGEDEDTTVYLMEPELVYEEVSGEGVKPETWRIILQEAVTAA